jgi:hypothetical protein
MEIFTKDNSATATGKDKAVIHGPIKATTVVNGWQTK